MFHTFTQLHVLSQINTYGITVKQSIAPQCMSAWLSAFLVSNPSILHASGFMTYCLACLRLHACVCLEAPWLPAALTTCWGRVSPHRTEKAVRRPLSTLTLPCYHALHACVFVCVKGIQDNGLVCVRACKADRIKYSRGEGRGDSEGFHNSLRQQFTHVNTHIGAHTLPGHLVHSSFTNWSANMFIPALPTC